MSNIDALSINTIRALAADITFEANSGHPGMRSIPMLDGSYRLLCQN